MKQKILFLGYGIDKNRSEAVSINTSKHMRFLRSHGYEVHAFNIGYTNSIHNTGNSFFGAIFRRRQTMAYLESYILSHKISHIVDVFVLPLSSLIFTAPLKDKFPKIKFIKEVHNLPGASKRLHSETIIRLIANNHFFYSRLFSVFDTLYTNSIDIAQNQAISYIPTPIKFHSVFSSKDRQNPLSVCYLGHPLPKKGIHEFKKLFEIIPSHLATSLSFHFAFSPMGPREAVVKELYEVAEKSSINVSFHSSVQASSFFRDHDVFVLPIHDHFGAVSTPNTVLESMEAGSVVMVTKLPSLNGVIENEINGIYLDVPTAENIIQKLQNLLPNADLRVRIRANARQLIKKRYQESVVINRLIKLYE